MIKYISFLLLIIFITNCSLDKKSGIWTKTKKIQVKKNKINEIKEIFQNTKVTVRELNSDYKIKLVSNPANNSFYNNFDNNNGRINYDGKLKGISKFKFSKIDDFHIYEPEIVFDEDNVIFFDNKGTVLKFNNSSELIWKKNHYDKYEKKQRPILFFANNKG